MTRFLSAAKSPNALQPGLIKMLSFTNQDKICR